MLNWLKRTEQQADHPMFDLEQAAQLLSELPKDPVKSLDELCTWLASVSEAEGFSPDLRARIVLLVEDAGQSLLAQLQDEYLKERPPQDLLLIKVASAGAHFCMHAAHAHARCLKLLPPAPAGEAAPVLPPQLAARGLRALFEQRKFAAMRCSAVDAEFWPTAFALNNAALAGHYAGNAVKAWQHDSVHTQVKLEFAKLLMLEIAHADSGPSRNVELIARAAARCGRLMALIESPTGCAFGIDLDKPSAPQRAAPGKSATLRFVDTHACLGQLQEMIARNNETEADPEQRFGHHFTTEEKLEVMRHLLQYWSSDPPRRRGVRVKLTGNAKVVQGYDAICEAVGGVVEGAPEKLSAMSYDSGEQKKPAAMPAPPESWRIENVSEHGVGLAIGGRAGAALKVGVLCAFRFDGKPEWNVGLLRRIRRDADDTVHAGIETLASGVALFNVNVVEQKVAQQPQQALGIDGATETAALGASMIALIQHHAGEALRAGLLIIAPAAYAEGRLFDLFCDGYDCRLRLTGAKQRGAGYLVAAFEPVSRVLRAAPEPDKPAVDDWR